MTTSAAVSLESTFPYGIPSSAPRAVKGQGGIHDILVAVDLTSRSSTAIQLAIDLARPLGASVRVLHVCPTTVFLATPAGEVVPGLDPEVVERAAQDQLSRLVARFEKDGIEMRQFVTTGNPATAILEVAKQLEVGMIILCSRGRSGIARALLGSVTETVGRNAGCPVVTVHAPPK